MQDTLESQAIRLVHGFGLENLVTETVRVPQPGPYEALVRVHAVSLNYRDLLTATGRYNPKQRMPLTLCSDGAGEVIAVGDRVTRWKQGDRVVAIFMQGWLSGPITREAGPTALGGGLDGMLTQLRVLHQDGLVAVPTHLSYEEAATLPCAAVTAWHSLVPGAHIRAGDTVLILGTGGVSIFALQFALLHGARVLVTSSSDEKLKKARALGASDTINYKTHPDWEAQVLELTGRRGVNAVVEVGGAGTFQRSIRSVYPGGHIGVIGNLSGLDASVNMGSVIQSSAVIQGIYVGSREMFEAMNRAISQHKLQPVIDHVFPFAEAKQAFEALQGAQHFGKIVISLPS